MASEAQFYTGEREESRSYSRAVKVGGGSTVYLAGVVDRDAEGRLIAGSFEERTRAVFERLREAVGVVGGTLADIVSMTVFITDARYGNEFVKLRREYFEASHYPASALITVAGLGDPELRVEIQATAVVDDSAQA